MTEWSGESWGENTWPAGPIQLKEIKDGGTVTFHNTPVIHGTEAPGMASREGVREFKGGANRNAEGAKFDYEGFLNPAVLYAYAHYMHEHRIQRDGSFRDADNWQLGIPFQVYIKSLVRHTIDLWRMSRGYTVINPDTGQPHTEKDLCCALIFNSMGYLKELVDPSEVNSK